MSLTLNSTERGNAAGYVGVTVSLVRTNKRDVAPSLRFGAGLRHQASPAAIQAGSVGSFRNSLAEIDVAGPQRGGLYVSGRRLSAAEGEGGLGTGEVLLIIAGVAGAAFLVSEVAGSDDDDDERCFIEPELCD